MGEAVLVTAASGGVGLAAVQIARLSGATVVAVTRSEAKRDALLEAGARHVLAAAEGEDFSNAVRALVPGGVEVVVDTVGSRVFTPALKVMAVGGRYVMVGQLFREEIAINPAFVFFQRARILGVGSVRRDQLENAVALAAAGQLRPLVARTMPLEQAAAAHEIVERGELVGRVVLTP